MKKFLVFVRKHAFGVIVVVFIFFICFISDHSYYHLHQLKQQQRKMEREIASYLDSIAEYEANIEEVSGNSEEMEKFAREKLMMRKANEDVYIMK